MGFGAVVILCLPVAQAGPVETYGFGAAAMGRGGGGVAVADGGMTVFQNPALLQRLEWAEATLGYAFNRSAFPSAPPLHWDTNRDGQLDDSDTPLRMPAENPRSDGMMVGMARNVGKRAGIALNAFMPADRYLRLRTTEPALPAWVMLGNRTQRLEMGLGLGVELYKGMSVGIATELVGEAQYRINSTIDIAAGGAESADEEAEDLIEYVRVDVHDMTLDLVPRFVPRLGVHWDLGAWNDALDGVQLGATWRASSGIPVVADIDLQVNGRLVGLGELEPINLALVMPVELSIFDHFVPERLSVGAAYQLPGVVHAYADLHHTKWSAMKVNVAHVTEAAIRSQVFQVEDDLLDDANEYSVEFENTVSVNTGVEIPLPEWQSGRKIGAVAVTLRAGFAYTPSPLVNQGPTTAFLDSDRMLFSGGLGVVHADALDLVPGPVKWDVFHARQRLAEGELVPDGEVRAGAPIDGQTIPVGGQLWSTGVQCSVSF